MAARRPRTAAGTVTLRGRRRYWLLAAAAAGLARRQPAVACVLAVTAAAVVLCPAGRAGAVAGAAGQPAAALRSQRPAARAARGPVATPFRGLPAVGALFVLRHGKLHTFCTAAMVRSPRQNLAITAAHCLLGRRLGTKGNVSFAPGYHNGRFPHGLWTVMSEIVDSNWRRNHNPNDDVAFLVIGHGRRIQRFTGAETVRTGIRLPAIVQVIGYPDNTNEPVTCTAPARALHLAGYRQLVFYCGGFTNGTSGGPFLMNVSRRTGEGEVVGVIGGYQTGGNLPDISYSAQFLRNVADLYKQAIS
jgi:V8-like Glu-specific endopeptidase